jgi:hypothetical protein
VSNAAGKRAWRGDVLAAVLWLAVCAGALGLAMLGLLTVPASEARSGLRSPVEIEHAAVALVVAQAFFLLFLWPLSERRRRARGVRAAFGAVLRVVALLALSAPLLLLARRTTPTGAWALGWSQGLVLLLGIGAGAAARLRGAVAWYYPFVFLWSAGLPFAAYVLRSQGGVDASWAGAVSPLWGVARVAEGGPPWGPLGAFGGLAAAAVAFLVVSAGSVGGAVGTDAS